MPPEPLPWDRKDYVFKDHRKHERGAGAGGSDAFGGGSSLTPRWRGDPYHVHHDFPRDSPRRPSPGHYRQGGGYHSLYPEDSRGYGCTPSRSDRFWMEDDSFRPSSARYGDGRSSSSISVRDGPGSLRRSPYGDSGDFTRLQNREHHHVTATRSVAVPISSASASQPSLKDQNETSGGENDGVGTDQKFDSRESSIGSIAWKPLKWSRSGSLTSIKASRSEAEDAKQKVTLPPGKETLIRSPVTSHLPSDEGAQRKKPRLGWGQGLAKYEKQKVEGSTDASSSGAKEPLSDTSPKMAGISGSLSPVTPCSRTCCSSQDTMEDKPCEVSIELDNLDINPITLTTLLADLLQPEDAYSGDSTFTRHSSLTKLLILKEDVSKELEKTECEIDLFENELKELNCDIKNGSHQSSSTSVAYAASEPCLQSCSTFSNEITHVRDHSEASRDVLLTGEPLQCNICNEKFNFEAKYMDNKQPPVVSSLVKEVSDSDSKEFGESSVNIVAKRFMDAEAQLISQLVEGGFDVAEKVFDAALPTEFSQSDIWGSIDLSECRRNYFKIKEKLAAKRRQLKFKEQVLALKFRAFHHLWKEDLHLLSLRKHRPKSSKRVDFSNYLLQNGSQKQRSSIRSRFALPGNLTLVPTTETVDFASKLLSVSQIKPYRKSLKMPALILDDNERRCTRFITSNGLIEDPLSFEKERKTINPWSQEEKNVFMGMLATFGKDFSKISSFLTHKTTADCIEFYYTNHKSESFREVKKRLDLRKKWHLPANTYLVTSGKKWNREVNAASLDMLGAASVVAAHNHETMKSQIKYSGKTIYGAYRGLKVSYGPYDYSGRTGSVDFSGHEKETVAADVLAGICGTLSAEAMSSCVTSSVDPSEKINYLPMDPTLTSEVNQSMDDEDTCSDEGCGDSSDWTDEEKSILVQALSMYGKDFARISTCIGTRSREQCKIFYSKARKCLGLDMVHLGTASGGILLNETNGGRSDTDDGCAAEMNSTLCSMQSCSRLDTDLSQSVANTSSEGFACAVNTVLQAETDRSSEQGIVGLEDDEKDDKQVSSIHNENLVVEQNNCRSDIPSNEGIDPSVRCNEIVAPCEVASSVDPGAKTEVSNHIVPPIELVSTNMEFVGLKPMTVINTWHKDAGGNVPVDGMKRIDEPKISLVPETGLMNRKQTNIDFIANSSGSHCFAIETRASGAALLPGNKVSLCPQLTSMFNYQSQVHLDLLHSLPKKQQNFIPKQEITNSLPLNLFLPVPSSISFGGHLNVASQSTINFEHGNKRRQDTLNKDVYQQCILGKASINQNKQFRNLRGYPLQVLNQQDKKKQAGPISEKPVTLDAYFKKNGFSHSGFFLSDLYGNKGNLPCAPHSRSCSPGPLSEKKSEDQMRPCVENSLSDSEEHRTGDVKLFGKILSHPSSLQKSSSAPQEINSRPLSLKPNRSSKVPTSNGKDCNLFACRPGGGSHIGLEEPPVRSHGFRDGNRIQTGFSSLPESTVMLANYQGSLTGVSLYPVKVSTTSGTGVLTDYQQSYMQHLAKAGTLAENFTELQNRNGIEMVSRQGTNVMRGGILGSNGGVSDPVAALQMHYASKANMLKGELMQWRDVEGR